MTRTRYIIKSAPLKAKEDVQNITVALTCVIVSCFIQLQVVIFFSYPFTVTLIDMAIHVISWAAVVVVYAAHYGQVGLITFNNNNI